MVEPSVVPDRTIVALSERVAVVETKIGGLKDDTGVIRGNIHNINNELQRVVAAEIRCADALEALSKIITDRGHQVEKISASVETLLVTKGRAEGAWAATARITSAIVAAIGILATVGAGLAWSLGHVAIR